MTTDAALLSLGLVGLRIGSFVNVVVHRVPAGMSVVTPGSSCPACDAPVRPRDNIPLLSWLLLRGRCRDCEARISGRYPAVEVVTALAFVATGVLVEATPYLLAVLAVTAAGIALFLIDLEHRRLPFAVTGVTAVVATALLVVDAVVRGRGPVVPGVASAGLWLGVYGAIWWVTSGRGMGLGDVALAPLLGLVLGWQGWGPSLVGLLGGFVVGALVGVWLLAVRRAAARTQVPHGPFMLLGAAFGLVAGQSVWHAYLTATGLA